MIVICFVSVMLLLFNLLTVKLCIVCNCHRSVQNFIVLVFSKNVMFILHVE